VKPSESISVYPWCTGNLRLWMPRLPWPPYWVSSPDGGGGRKLGPSGQGILQSVKIEQVRYPAIQNISPT